MGNRSGGGVSRDFDADVSRGVYSSSVTRVALISTRTVATALTGNPSLAEDIWPGPTATYSLPSAAESWEVLSDNAADTVGGVGAEQVSITALDTNYNQLATVIVSLNGTTPVTLPNGAAYYRLNNATIGGINPTSGRRRNQGTITVRVAGGGLTRAIIPPFIGGLRQAIYTVPAGFTLEIFNIEAQILSASGGGASQHGADFLLLFRNPNGTTTCPRPIGATDTQPYALKADSKIRINEKFDFIIQALYTSANSLTVGASWEAHLYKN